MGQCCLGIGHHTCQVKLERGMGVGDEARVCIARRAYIAAALLACSLMLFQFFCDDGGYPFLQKK